MTSSSSWTRLQRPLDVSGGHFVLEKVSPSIYDRRPLSGQHLVEDEQLQQEMLGTARANMRRNKNPYVSQFIIGTVPGGDLRLHSYDEFEAMALSHKQELPLLSRYYGYKEMESAHMDKTNSIVGAHARELEDIESKIKACYASLSEHDDDGYVPLFSSPSPRPMRDLPVQDESTRAMGPPSMDIPTASSAATEAHAQVHAQIAELEKQKGALLSRISEAKADLKIELHKLKSSARFTMLENDYPADTDLIQHMYKASMLSFHETLSSALGVGETSKLAAAAGAVHDLPSEQASKMWAWIVRASSRSDQAYLNARFENRNPFDYEPSSGLLLTTAFAELASREQHFEQMGNVLTPSSKLALRMRIVPTNDSTRLILQLFGKLPTKEVDTETLRSFEQQLANLKGLKAAGFRTQPQSAQPQSAQQRGAPPAKQPAAARLAQRPPPQPPHARTPEVHAPSQRLHSPGAPIDPYLCRKHNGLHLYSDCPDHPRNCFRTGDKVVSFGGDNRKVDLEARSARSAKALATTGTVRQGGSFTILGGLDDDNIPLTRLTSASPSAIQPEKTYVLSAKDAGKLNGAFACVDSGASLHIVNEKLITEDRKIFEDGTVVWGDGSSIKTVASGTVSTTLVGKDGTTQKIRFPAWGVPHLETPLLSATALAQGGAALHVEKGNSYLDFRKLGGTRLYIPDDCMVRFNLTGSKQPISAKANLASSKPNRRRNSGQRSRRLVSAPGN